MKPSEIKLPDKFSDCIIYSPPEEKRENSESNLCYKYFHTQPVPNTCPEPNQKLELIFSHEGELPYPKNEIKAFWEEMDETIEIRKEDYQRSSKAKNSLQRTSRSNDSTSNSQSEEEIPYEERPIPNMLEMLMNRGVDEAALAIKPDYPLEPKVCTCGDCCCPCIFYSSILDSQKLERERMRLIRQGKLKPGEDPFPSNIRRVEPQSDE